MSTQHDIGKEQEGPPQALPPLHTQDTLQEEKISPAQAFPQPPQRPPRPKANRWLVIGAVIVALGIILSLGVIFIPGLIQHPGAQVTPTPTAPVTPAPATDLTPTPAPGVVLGPQACPSGTGSPAHWNAIIGTNNGEQQVESISCANIMDNPSLQALVLVRHTNANATLDVYVFNNITSSKPVRIFLLQGLITGDAKISGYNTVMTAEVDRNSTRNAGKPVSAMTADLFREFDWSASKGTLVQTAFPGIFPDLTRYQAENDQALVNQGQDTWKNDPKQVAQKLVVQFFSWYGTLTSTITSGGGAKDVYATVKVAHPTQGTTKPPYVNVTLSRLEGDTHNMWVAIGVEDGTGTLTSVTARSLIASPVKVEGKGESFGGAIGEVYILDHLYTTVGQAHVSASNGLGPGVSPYSLLVSYDTSFKQGPQEGIVELQLTSTMGPTAYSAMMVKVLLDPQPNVALGPMSCPVAVQQAGYWESHFGIFPTTVTCGNLKGPAYIDLLALVTVSPSDSEPGHLYVYDLTQTPPLERFSLQANSAKISGMSTIITADADLYREYAWSGNDFVQVAFPGMYPDLTRWQAEDHQAAVMQGPASLKLSALETAGKFVAQFMRPPPGNSTKLELALGGGPNDLTAGVNVTYVGPGQPNTNIPVTQLTLKRLEGYYLNGIWEVTSVESNGLFIYTPKSGTTITSPWTVTGFGPQYEGQIGVVYILDRLYHEIQYGNNFAKAPSSLSPPSKFSLEVSFKSSIQGGVQEGIVELDHPSGPTSAGGVVMVKVLVNP